MPELSVRQRLDVMLCLVCISTTWILLQVQSVLLEAAHEVGCGCSAAHHPVEQPLIRLGMEGALTLRPLTRLAAILTATGGTAIASCTTGKTHTKTHNSGMNTHNWMMETTLHYATLLQTHERVPSGIAMASLLFVCMS